MAKCYELEGVIPVIHPTAYVHPDAVLIGDAVVGAKCYVGPGAVMRGDMGRVELKDGANLQDNCIMHSFPSAACIVEENGHIGHGAILHGCRVGFEALVGMNAVVMDEAMIGPYSIVAASACVPSKMNIPERSLVAGVPAKRLRDLTDQEVAWKMEGTVEYQVLAERCHASLKETSPLRTLDKDRPRLQIGDVKTLKQTRET